MGILIAAGALLILAMIYACLKAAGEADNHTAMRTCSTCRHHLGGGACRLNLESECAAGDYEAWERREDAHGR